MTNTKSIFWIESETVFGSHISHPLSCPQLLKKKISLVLSKKKQRYALSFHNPRVLHCQGLCLAPLGRSAGHGAATVHHR